MKELKAQEKKLAAIGEQAPHRPPKPPPAGEAWPPSGGKDKGRGTRPWLPAGSGKCKDGKSKGEGKNDKGGKGKKGRGKRKGAATTWGEWSEDSYWGEWPSHQLNPVGTWAECDWDNGYLGEDGFAWINLKPNAAADNAGQGASLLQQQAAV